MKTARRGEREVLTGVALGGALGAPTAERVVTMLGGTSRAPQEVVGLVPPYHGPATVEKVAINAVMAGCHPEHLPFVLAAVEAACDERFALQGVVATTYPVGPLIIATGPRTDQVGMNAAGNCLGDGGHVILPVGGH